MVKHSSISNQSFFSVAKLNHKLHKKKKLKDGTTLARFIIYKFFKSLWIHKTKKKNKEPHEFGKTHY